MHTGRKWAMFFVFAVYLCAAVSVAGATVIDTTQSDEWSVYDFGYLNTATYGQTFQIASPDTVLTSFSLYLRDRFAGSGPLNLRGYLASWDGTKASQILYQSDTRTMNAEGNLQQFQFETHLTLKDVGWYVAFLSVSDLGPQQVSQFYMPYSGDVMPGNFVFLNSGTDFGQVTSTPWLQNFYHDDVWFSADLIPVPEPATAAFVALGLGALFLVRRRAA